MEMKLAEVEHLNRWCEDKPVMLGLFASQIVSAFEPTFELVRMCRSETGLFALSRSGTCVQRLAFYTDHRRLRRELLQACNFEEPEIAGSEGLLDGLSWLSRADKSVISAELKTIAPAEWKTVAAEAVAAAAELWREHWADLKGEIPDDVR